MQILIVEDNSALNCMMASFLRERGFTVAAVTGGRDALAALADVAFDAVVLDLGLPDLDGMDVLRNMPNRVPTLILTARDGVAHRIAGLNEGADDYILKPFDLAEFEARLRAVLRRPGTREAPSPLYADLRYDAACRSARVGDHTVELTRQEAILFEALVRSGERIVVRDALADKMYSDDGDVTGNALEATVSRLRRKLASLGSEVKIETVRGVGYRLRRETAPP